MNPTIFEYDESVINNRIPPKSKGDLTDDEKIRVISAHYSPHKKNEIIVYDNDDGVNVKCDWNGGPHFIGRNQYIALRLLYDHILEERTDKQILQRCYCCGLFNNKECPGKNELCNDYVMDTLAHIEELKYKKDKQSSSSQTKGVKE